VTRSEFSKSTKLAAFARSGGRCETCGYKIVREAEHDHIVPAAIGGSNDLENCRVLCKKCHSVKTSKVDVPQIAKSVRIYEKRAGVRKPRRPFQKRVDPWGKGRQT
jgi:5-methylcytosine-specific restriction endonuclease McrA